MSGHTPGPWHVTGETWEGDGAAGVQVDNENGYSVAFCTSWTHRGHPHTAQDVDYANAHLIAAAPELLHCLKVIVCHAKDLADMVAALHLDKAIEAIAKAEGEV